MSACQRIDRPFPNGVESILVPAGYTAAFWNAAIDALVEQLREGGARSAHPTPTQAGLYGTVNLEARQLLCTGYLYAEDAERLCYAELAMVGRVNAGDMRDEKRMAKEFRLGAAVRLEQYPVVIDGVDLGAAVALEDRWTLLLAAYYQVARRGARARDYYDSAVERCQGGGEIESVALGSRGYRIDAEPWDHANQVLGRPAEAALLLARLFFHVLCVRLFVVPASRPANGRHLFTQMRDWLQALADQWLDSRVCAAHGGPHMDGIRKLLPALVQLLPFGGEKPLDPGPEFPACFRPYGGGPELRLDLLLRDVDPAHRDAVSQAYLLAVLVVDKLMDPRQARRAPMAAGGGFNRFAYNSLMLAMKRMAAMGAGRPPHANARLQLQRFAEELARDDQRHVEHLAQVMLGLPPPVMPLPLPAYAACTACRKGIFHRGP